jgi:2,3-dihydroxyethylbenzene 1,2-dioxygenase
MVQVTELGYIGIHVSDMESWKDYGTSLIGFECRDEGEGDRYYFRMDYWHHRIVVHQGKEDDLAYMGWRVADPIDFEAIMKQLENCNIPFRVASKEETEERRVLGLLKLEDPAGNAVEIFYGPQVDYNRPFHPGRPMHGKFLVGDDFGMGHFIARENDAEEAFRFYANALGMRGSIEYHIPSPGGIAKPVFMHCNKRQHSIAFGLGNMPKRINHLMLEYTHLDDVGQAYQWAKTRGIPIGLALGKHANDQALTFYMQNPSGWLCELGWNARLTPAQQEYYLADIWGHEVVTPGLLDLELDRN